MTSSRQNARGRARGERASGYVIRTAEGDSAILVPSVRGAAASQRAIEELLGPVYEQRADRQRLSRSGATPSPAR